MEAKAEQLKRLKKFRDDLKKYMEACGPRWRAINAFHQLTDEERALESKLRESLTEEFGRLENLFRKLGIQLNSIIPAIRVPFSIFDTALSADFEGSRKGESLQMAISLATKAIGVLDSFSEKDYKTLNRKVPVLFMGHSFLEEHKEALGLIKEFVAGFPVSIITGEKPTTGEVSEKVKGLIDDSDFVMAILTKDKAGAGEDFLPSKWVMDEIAYSMGKGKKVIRMLEEGVTYEAALSADAEYIQFKKEDLSLAFIKLGQVLNGLLNT